MSFPRKLDYGGSRNDKYGYNVAVLFITAKSIVRIMVLALENFLLRQMSLYKLVSVTAYHFNHICRPTLTDSALIIGS
jgi:hypothetical protein